MSLLFYITRTRIVLFAPYFRYICMYNAHHASRRRREMRCRFPPPNERRTQDARRKDARRRMSCFNAVFYSGRPSLAVGPCGRRRERRYKERRRNK